MIRVTTRPTYAAVDAPGEVAGYHCTRCGTVHIGPRDAVDRLILGHVKNPRHPAQEPSTRWRFRCAQGCPGSLGNFGEAVAHAISCPRINDGIHRPTDPFQHRSASLLFPDPRRLA